MTDLLDTDDAVLVVDSDWTPPERERQPRFNADGLQLGICRVCGDEASSPNGTYCSEHRTRQPRGEAPQPGTTATVPTSTARVTRPPRTPTGKNAPTADEWNNKLFQKVIGAVTDLMASSLVRRNNLNDPTGQLADSLAMTDEEATRVAKPIGRFVAGTALNKRVGRKVLDNSDLLDAAFALYDWYDRVDKTLKGNTRLAVVRPIQPQPESQGGENEQTESEISISRLPDDGSFPAVHGSHYVP